MATVKLTDNLKAQIMHKISAGFEVQRRPFKEQIEGQFTFDEVRDAWIADTGGAELYARAEHWMSKSHYLSVSDINGVPIGSGPLSRPDRIAVKVPYIPNSAVIPSLKAKTDIRAAALAQLEKLDKEARQLHHDVVHTINSYGSVNSAVKVHPDLLLLLPEDAKQKMAQKSTKAPPPSPIAVGDLSKIAAVAVMARMDSSG